MEPSDFLSRDEFEALDEEEREQYVARFEAALAPLVHNSSDTSRQLDFFEHYLDLQQWTLPQEEYERAVTSRWDLLWAHAREIPAVFEAALASSCLSHEQRAWVEANLERVRAFAAHKRDVEDLPTADG